MDLQSRLALNQEEFMEDETFRVCCGTFNVNGKYPDESLRPWLAELQKSPSSGGGSGGIDVYAIGFQEIVDLTTSSFILKTDWDKKEASWVEAVKEVIESQNNNDSDSNNNNNNNYNEDSVRSGNKASRRKYRLLRKERMYGVMVLVFVSDKLPVSQDLVAQVPMGVLGSLGNKGSVGVSFKIHETRVCFISSHFASDPEKVEKRNSDFRNTVKNLIFSSPTGGLLTIEEHDMVFWFGDFNYRIERLTLLDTLNKIYSNETEFLLKYDQLTIERSSRRVFANFMEGPVKFRPTYKYLIKSDRYEKETVNMSSAMIQDSPSNFDPNSSLDSKSSSNSSSNLDSSYTRSFSSPGQNGGSATTPTSPSLKTKLPSWTDRILWRSNDASRVKQLKYFCANTVTISDHKPVCGLFEVSIAKINMTKLCQTYQLINKAEDKRLNEEIPRITVDRNELNFGDSCYYYDSTTLEIVVKNESDVSRANVSVVFRDENLTSLIDEEAEESSSSTGGANDWLAMRTSLNLAAPAKPNPSQWLIISPTHRENVGPGEQFTVELTLNLNKHIHEKLDKSSPDKLLLQDFVILKCTGGNHIFVSVSCSYKPTVIGLSLRALSILSTSSFDEFSKPKLFEAQSDINKFEKELDTIWTSKMRGMEPEKTALSKRSTGQSSFFGNVVSTGKPVSAAKSVGLPSESSSNKKKSSSFTTHRTVSSSSISSTSSRQDTYYKCLTSLRSEVVRNDRFFKNDLPIEYAFLLDHMISKATKELAYLDNIDSPNREDQENSTAAAGGRDQSVEEIKNQILVCLSKRAFKEMQQANHDMELLCELLYDLLYAMPQPLIPIRYFDYCISASTSYDDLVRLFDFLPKAHVKLFELIVRFLQIFLKCLTSCDSNFDSLLANAIFQIDRRPVPTLLRSSPSSLKNSSFVRSRSNTSDLCQKSQSQSSSVESSLESTSSNHLLTNATVRQATYTFIHKFVLNHHKFMYIVVN